MATSGSYNFTTTRDTLITDALLEIGVLRDGQSPSTDQVTAVSRVLNMLVKTRSNDNVFRWTYKRGFILPFSDSPSIDTNSHVVTFYDTAQVDTDASSGASTLVIDDAGTMAISDQLGIELDDGSIQWTTITNIASTTLTLTDVLDDDVGEGNRVYAYTASSDRVQRPLEITQANSLEVSSGASVDIDLLNRNDYYQLQNRDQEGDPIKLFYDERLGTIDTTDPTASTWAGRLFIWPPFQNGNKIIEFSYRRPIQDFDASTDNPDLPQEYYLPVVKELAALICGRYGVPSDVRKQLHAEAKLYWDMSESVEETVKIEPKVYGK